MKTPFLYLLASVFFLGCSNIFFKKSSLAIGALSTTVWYYVFGCVLAIVLALVTKEKVTIHVHELKPVMFLAGCIFLSVYCYTKAIEDVSVGIASTVRSLSFVVTICVSFFMGEMVFSLKTIIGIVLAMAALFLLN